MLIDIYTQIKNILCKEKISTSNISTKSNGNYKLQQNVVHGEWTDDYEFYNCYAYAIGKTEKDYNYTYQYQPGDFVKDGREYLRNVFTIDGLANLVKDDLETLGYKVNISLNQPLFINDDQELIALRNIYHWDYHFMRYDKNDRQWYHKPGNTAILRYLHHPSDLLWLQEFYTLKDGPETTGEYYDSDVYYITFTKNYYSNNNVSFSIVDQEITIDKIDGYLEYDIHLLSPIYYEHNVYNVTKIQANSFKDQTRLQSINIPSSINYIGSCAFENTNNAEIYFNKINSIPKIFSERWNISKNPVYLDMDLCTHEIKNNKYNDSTHKRICERCQTMLKEEAHNYIDLICHLRCTDCEHKKVIKHNLSYTPLYYDNHKHIAYCTLCDYERIEHCIGNSFNNNQDILCIFCNQLITPGINDINLFFYNLNNYSLDNKNNSLLKQIYFKFLQMKKESLVYDIKYNIEREKKS